MKKIGIFIVALVLSSINLIYAQDDGTTAAQPYTLGNWWFRWQTTIFNPDVPDAENFEGNVVSPDGSGANSLLNTVKTAINRVLGLLAFIALCFLLYGGFKILIAGTDDAAVGEAQAIVKNAAYGIIFIALSWVIVTFIFYVAGILTDDSWAGWANQGITPEVPWLETASWGW